MRLLVVEDDPGLSDVLWRGLSEEGFTVDLCGRGDEAVLLAELTQYDGIILDVMLPGKSGIQVCRELRSTGARTPVLMLTARDTVDDVVSGLEAGADDYLVKPFAFRELRARLQAILRRGDGMATPLVTIGAVTLDLAKHEVRRGEERIPLTNREFQVFTYLAQNRGRVLTRLMIEDSVWGSMYAGLSNTVDVQIKRLRAKLDVPGHPSIIETVRGAGYRLADTPD